MMRGTKAQAQTPVAAFVNGKEAKEDGEWEVRPGGMLVQKRNPDDVAAAVTVAPTIRVKVKYCSAYHEIYLSSQSTFGELKKRMSERTGLHPGDQKLVFKDKERDSGAYLDISGVKDGSKMVLLEDPAAQAKRLLDARREAKAEKVAKSIASVSVEVDRLAPKVSALEAIVLKGKRVAETDLLALIELLMTQLIKLDGIVADGDAKRQRGVQVRRVQKYVETLDLLKIKNAMCKSDEQVHQKQRQQQQQQKPRPSVVSTKWETFDSLFSPTASSAASTATSAAPTPRFDWELF